MASQLLAWSLNCRTLSLRAYAAACAGACGARHARYSFFQRAARFLIVGRSLPTFLAAYLLLDLALVGAEIVFNFYFPRALPGWTPPEIKSPLKDIASYLIAAQVGILGIVSVAIGIVTLIS
jgi:hypothetical protein